MNAKYVRWFEDVRAEDVGLVDGENASLGEMVGRLQEAGIRVPAGFATTVSAFRYFIEHNNLAPRIKAQLDAMAAKRATLDETGRTIRELFLQSEFPQEVADDIRAA